LFDGLHIIDMAVVASLVFVAVIAISRVLPVTALGLVGGLFVASAVVSVVVFFSPEADIRRTEASLLTQALALIDDAAADSDSCVALDRIELSQWHRYNYRAVRPRVEFNEFKSSEAGAPCPVVLSSSVQPAAVGAELMVGSENNINIQLYVADGTLSDTAEDWGWVFPIGWDGLIPEASQVGTVAVTLDETGSGSAVLEGAILNAGQLPWPSARSQTPGSAGPVRVALLDSRGDIRNRFEISNTAYPGLSVGFSGVLGAAEVALLRSDGRLVLFQEGVALWTAGGIAIEFVDRLDENPRGMALRSLLTGNARPALSFGADIRLDSPVSFDLDSGDRG
jgi:hypothetical protein